MRRCLHCLRLGEGGWHGGFGWYAWRGRRGVSFKGHVPPEHMVMSVPISKK
jgi:hypothetical protein